LSEKAAFLVLYYFFEKIKNNLVRIFTIDFGTNRIGIAVTDELQIIASGLTSVNTKDLLTFFKGKFYLNDAYKLRTRNFLGTKEIDF
jgi:hypothetical protein